MSAPTVICETCGGDGSVVEFRRFAGEYQAGEPYEVPCHDCGGVGEWDAGCDYCTHPAITELDGDNLCQRHADEWVRSQQEDERDAA